MVVRKEYLYCIFLFLQSCGFVSSKVDDFLLPTPKIEIPALNNDSLYQVYFLRSLPDSNKVSSIRASIKNLENRLNKAVSFIDSLDNQVIWSGNSSSILEKHYKESKALSLLKNDFDQLKAKLAGLRVNVADSLMPGQAYGKRLRPKDRRFIFLVDIYALQSLERSFLIDMLARSYGYDDVKKH